MTSLFESRPRTLLIIFLAGFALVALNAVRSLPQISDLFLNADGDDQMRLLQVRDWLAGQSWFDTRQYRVLPPEGISMHWSRYIDLGIAAFLTAAAQVLPADMAETATLILWPSFLACLMVVVLSRGSSQLFGPAAAVGALAVFFTWGKLGGEFVAPRIDHHNMQILCGSALFYLSLVPGRPVLRGALAGAVTALSLAVGLEMLPFLAAVWGLMALRHAFDEPGSGTWLLAFAGGISVSAPLFFAGQTAFSNWGVPWCDVLAPPVMSLGAVGVVATTIPVLAAKWLRGPAPRILTLLAITGAGLWLAFPVLGHCLAGPYSDVPLAVRRIIEGNVSEALSAETLIGFNPDLLARVLGPPLLITLLAVATAWHLWPQLDRARRTALVQAVIVTAIGFGFALYQIRAANLMTPAIPLLAGFLVHAFTLLPRSSRLRLPAAILLVVALPGTVERASTRFLHGSPSAAPGQQAGTPMSDCRTTAAMTEIASLPRSTLFTTLNLGAAVLVYTPNSVTSAGYHRSPAAFWNGIGAFEDEAALRRALFDSQADFLVLCTGGSLERRNPQLQTLMSGNLPVWLTDATGDRTSVRVFKINSPALAAALQP